MHPMSCHLTLNRSQKVWWSDVKQYYKKFTARAHIYACKFIFFLNSLFFPFLHISIVLVICANRKNLQSKSNKSKRIRQIKSSEWNRPLLRIERINHLVYSLYSSDSLSQSILFAERITGLLTELGESNRIDLLIHPIRTSEYYKYLGRILQIR